MDKEKQFRLALGKRIRETRIKKQMTQAQLAEILDCSNNYISEIELGHINISIKKLIQLSDVLEVDLAKLIVGNVDSIYTIQNKLSLLGEKDMKLIETIIDKMIDLKKE